MNILQNLIPYIFWSRLKHSSGVCPSNTRLMKSDFFWLRQMLTRYKNEQIRTTSSLMHGEEVGVS
jgi:hypothetical protein